MNSYFITITIIAICCLFGNAYGDVVVGYSSAAKYVIKAGTDATPKVALAIQDAANSGSGPVIFEAGLYWISSPLVLSTGVELKGTSTTGTILKLMNNVTSWVNDTTTVSGMIHIVGADNGRVSFMTLDGNRANQNTSDLVGKYGVYIQDSQGVSIWQCVIRNFGGYGVALHETSMADSVHVDAVTIDYSNITNNGWDGVVIDSYENVAIRFSTISGNRGHGVNMLDGSNNVVITNNTFVGNGYYFPADLGGSGVNMNLGSSVDASAVHIVTNVFDSNFYAGVSMTNVINADVARNVIRNSEYCMTLSNTDSSNMTRNVCENILSNANLVDSDSQSNNNNLFLMYPFVENNVTVNLAMPNATIPTTTMPPPDAFPADTTDNSMTYAGSGGAGTGAGAGSSTGGLNSSPVLLNISGVPNSSGSVRNMVGLTPIAIMLMYLLIV